MIAFDYICFNYWLMKPKFLSVAECVILKHDFIYLLMNTNCFNNLVYLQIFNLRQYLQAVLLCTSLLKSAMF